MKIHEISAKSALHYHRQAKPCHWDLNIYRGCQHRCRYCFAHYSHQWLQSDAFYDEIFVKVNIAEILNGELSGPVSAGQAIAVGGVTDSYQPVERRYRLMRDVLRVLIRQPVPTVLVTKSDLVLRDLDLISVLARKTTVYAGISLSSVDDTLGRILEPGAALPSERIRALRELQRIGCNTTVLYMPVVPGLTDRPEQIDAVYAAAAAARFDTVLPGLLGLQGRTAREFYSFLGKNYPDMVPWYRQLYGNRELFRRYRKGVYACFGAMQQKYSLLPPVPPPPETVEDFAPQLF